MTRGYIYIVFLMLIQQTAVAQLVWPGDVNNNGIVNKVDFLYLGYAFGETGNSRTVESGNWEGQPIAENWNGTFPNGLNFLYADCNGDGIVNEEDAEIVAQNAGRSHNDVPFTPDEFIRGAEGVNPACRLMNGPSVAPVNQLFTIDIGLGDLDLPINNMIGLSFIIDVDPDILGVANTTLTFSDDSWIEPNDEAVIQIQQKDDELARLKVGFTKTDRIPLSGHGNLASVSFLIEEDIVNFLVRDTVTYTIDSIIVLTEDLEPIPIVPDTLKLAIDKIGTVSIVEEQLAKSIEVYPNPNSGFLLIASESTALEKIELVNSLGQTVFTQKLNQVTFQGVDFQHLEDGIYWAKIHSQAGIKTQLIQKY